MTNTQEQDDFRVMEGFHPLEIYHGDRLICVAFESKYQEMEISRWKRAFNLWFISKIEHIDEDEFLKLKAFSSVFKNHGERMNFSTEKKLKKKQLSKADYADFLSGWRYVSKGDKFIHAEAGQRNLDFVLFEGDKECPILKIPVRIIGT